MDLLQRAVDECGPWMFVTLAGASFMLAVLLERGITLFFRFNIRADVFLDQIEKLVRAGNTDRALKLAAVLDPRMPLGQVVRAGLQHAGEGPDRARAAMEAAAARALPQLRRRRFVPLFAGDVVLMLGVLGSVQLGAFATKPGVATPLPFGQPVAMAPLMLGVLVTVVGTLGFVSFLSRGKRLEGELALAQRRLAAVIAEPSGGRPPQGYAAPVDAPADDLPRLGNIGLPPSTS